MSDETYRANDAVAVKQREAKAKRKADQSRDDLQELLKLPVFRRFAWRLIHERCQIMQSPASANGSLQSMNIGRSDVGRELWSEIERANPEIIPQMMLEYAESQKA